VYVRNDPPWGNPLSCTAIPPTNLEIDDTDLVASLSHLFEKMVGLMWPSFDPIRFLEDEDAQGIQTLMHEQEFKAREERL